MFEGYGVGLTVAPLGLEDPDPAGPSGVVARPSRLSEVLPVGEWSDAEQALELERVQVLKGVLAAYESHLVVSFAGRRPAPDAAGPRPGRSRTDGTAEGPIPGTSEFFVDELAVVTNTSARWAGVLAQQSYVLVERLPVVWAALADGALDVPRARLFIDVLGPTAVGVAEAVSAEVLPEAAGLSLGRLRRRLTRAALAADQRSPRRRGRRPSGGPTCGCIRPAPGWPS